MAKLHGKGGSIAATVGSPYVTNIRSWTIDYVADVAETTDFPAAGVKEFIVGGTGWTGSYDGIVDDTAVQVAAGTTATIEFKMDGTRKVAGAVIILGPSISVAVDSEETVSYAFQGTGGLTIT